VEVLSPSTQVVDRHLKLQRFERAAMPSSWLVDPTGPTLFAYELRKGRYALVGDVTGDEEWTASLPFPVTIRPSTLLR
jgi:Uma2 family endonuclease